VQAHLNLDDATTVALRKDKQVVVASQPRHEGPR
jgi:hypothetical protein